MRELGHVEGKTWVSEHRYADGRAERLPELARELVVKTESVYRRYAIADEGMLRDGGTKLEALHQADEPAERTVIPISEAPKRA